MKLYVRVKHFLFLFIYIFPLSNSNAQVTIGMGTAPTKTALLQLKDRDPDKDTNETSRTGGFLLPRVNLVQKTTLQPFMQESDPNYDTCKTESVGLMVYNLATIDGMTPGIYYWDGEKWKDISPENNPSPPVPEIDDPKALDLPNSYIINPGHSESIPVMKGFAVWHQELGKKQEELKGNLKAELLWQSQKELIKNISLTPKNKIEESFFVIETNDNKTEGNAVVAIKLNESVLWSWHIWITYYEPDDKDGQRINGNYIFMDRNLGALTCNKDAIYSFGMLYQWGRKDPFPGSSHLSESYNEREIFDLNGNSASLSKIKVSIENNLENSIKNPMIFYSSGESNDLSKPEDWYSTSPEIENNYLWTKKDNTKGIYDPCPEGWRVPDKNAWNTQQWIESYRSSTEGLDLENANPQGGFYPSTGYREMNTGSLILRNIKAEYCYATVWSSTARTKDDGKVVRKSAHALLYRPNTVHNPATSDTPRPKARGGSVRCIVDNDSQK